MDLSQWIERHADFQPDRPALLFEGNTITYADFDRRIRRLAAMLKHGLGVGRGDRVAHLGYNSPELLDLVFACARLGAMVVPLNWRLAAPEHLYILQNAAVSVVFAEPDFQAHIDGIRAQLKDCKFVGYDKVGAGWLDYDALLQAAAGDDRNPHVSYESPLLIVYTSGTTGRPKGAVLTQNAILWNAINSTHAQDITRHDRILTFLPMFHVGGMNIQTTPALHAGATILIQRRFEPGAALQAIREFKPTILLQVPAALQAMMQHPEWATTDLSCIRLAMTGSTIVPLPLIRALLERGIPCGQVYGSTETAPTCIYLRGDDGARKIGSCGKPALHCEVRVVDDQGRDVDADEPGEILVRGPNVMFEYWGNEEATAEALRDGWFHTGDIGYRDAEGFYYVNERKKDMIISGSENIYPAELEAVLAECPDIQEAAVVARPDAKWGEVAVAMVVRKQGSRLGPEEVLALFRGRLARFKHPHDVIFVEALPRNVMGKVLKYQLREMLRR
jgi:fatty-acyl-CoA synthase